MWGEDIGAAMLFYRDCSYTLPPIDSMQIGGHYNFLKISLLIVALLLFVLLLLLLLQL